MYVRAYSQNHRNYIPPWGSGQKICSCKSSRTLRMRVSEADVTTLRSSSDSQIVVGPHCMTTPWTKMSVGGAERVIDLDRKLDPLYLPCIRVSYLSLSRLGSVEAEQVEVGVTTRATPSNGRTWLSASRKTLTLIRTAVINTLLLEIYERYYNTAICCVDMFRFTNLVRVGKRYLIVKVSGSGHVHYLPHLFKEGCSHTLMVLCADSHVPRSGW